MKVNPLTRLRYFIIDHYDLSELQILCHDLSIRYDMLGGDNRLDVKADRLLRKLGRQRRFDDLLALLRQTRREPFEQRKVDDLKPEILEDALSGFVEEQSGEESTKLERSSSRSRNSDRYEIQEELGRGSFATVYKALDKVLNRTMALKILHPHMRGAPGAVARFKFEAQMAGSLRHPNIVGVEDFGHLVDGQLFLAMDYLPGRTLENYLNEHGILTLDQAVPILEQVASALDYAHEQGVIHRDLKPANVMIEETEDGPRATLTDFGLVKAIEGTMAQSMQAGFFGTMEYMAPEQADIHRQAEVGPATDRYSLGVLAYRMLTGQVPFPGKSLAVMAAIANNPPPAPREIRSDIPESAETALLKNLAKDPKERFTSCLEFVAGLSGPTLAGPDENLASLYGKLLQATVNKNWVEVLMLGGQIRGLSPGYRDVAGHIARAQEALSQPRREKSEPASVQKPRKTRRADDKMSAKDEPEDIWVNPKTGKEMVLVPAGSFLFGEEKDERQLPDFWIDKALVTNADYARFVADTGHEPPRHWEGKKEPPAELRDHPVVWVSWEDANRYAIWAGGSLPSEEQWEKAARGTDGRTYPWGDDWQDGLCNTEEAGIGSTTPVGQFSPTGDSPYGCIDMSGNVWEWTNSKVDRLYKIKGGGHHSSKDAARASAGYNLNHTDKYGYCGFRILSASTFSTSDR